LSLLAWAELIEPKLVILYKNKQVRGSHPKNRISHTKMWTGSASIHLGPSGLAFYIAHLSCNWPWQAKQWLTKDVHMLMPGTCDVIKEP
jgi:hypothetical protein